MEEARLKIDQASEVLDAAAEKDEAHVGKQLAGAANKFLE